MFRVLILICVALVSGCAQLEPISPLAPLERSVLFQPTAYPKQPIEVPGLPIEEVWIESGEATLHGLYVPHPNPVGVALYCHGNAGTVADRIQTLALMNQRHNLSVLIFDYQGFGKSTGKPTQTGILSDARTARRWLAEKEEIDEAEIILLGRSLGGAVAIDLAAEDGARGLILASTFTNLPDVAAHHFKLLPVRILMTHRMNSVDKIKKYHGPLLYSHGQQDEVIPYKLGQELFEAAPGPKQFVSIPDGTHNSGMTEEYRETFDRFIRSLD